jgi:hypothetical protein
MTQAELRGLLRDCMRLWDVPGEVTPAAEGVHIAVDGQTYAVTPADAAIRPVRWFYQTPERAAAGRPPRAAPSIVALLSALRNALGVARAGRLRIGAG